MQASLQRLQQGRGLPATGQLNPATVTALGLDPNNPASPAATIAPSGDSKSRWNHDQAETRSPATADPQQECRALADPVIAGARYSQLSFHIQRLNVGGDYDECLRQPSGLTSDLVMPRRGLSSGNLTTPLDCLNGTRWPEVPH